MSLPQIVEIKNLNDSQLREEILKVKKEILIYVLKNLPVNLLNRMNLNMQNIN
jgi:hypothetical protein